MEFKNGGMPISAGPKSEVNSLDSGEMDLYGELVTFIDLSPEDRQREATSASDQSKTAEEEINSSPTVEAAVVEVATRLAKEPDRFRGATAELPDLTRPSGPLAGLFLPPKAAFSGALTRGVCLACGAESGADDVFCVSCGAFIDEVDSAIQQEPTCADCGERIVPDEIFCPSCGASLSLV